MLRTITLAAALLLLAACSITGAATQDETISIGVVGTMTGVGAYQGQQELRGLEIARDEINTQGGISGKRVELVVEDSAANPATAVTAVQKLINLDDVNFIIGDSWSSTTVSFIPHTNENDVLVISPEAILDQLSQDDLFFRTVPSVDSMMEVLAVFAYEEVGSRRVAILYQETPFGQEHADDFARYFEKLGGDVVLVEHFPLSQRDHKTELTKAKGLGVDTIMNFHASGSPTGLLMKQGKELGLAVHWFSHFAAENGPLVRELGDAVDGLYYPYYFTAQESAFAQEYALRFESTPDATAANAYDALMLLAEAIEATGSEDPYAVKDYLLTVEKYEGASGTITFDKRGDVQKPIIIKQIIDGAFVVVG